MTPPLQRQLIDGAWRYIEQVYTELSPPENAVGLYALFADILMYRKIKVFVRITPKNRLQYSNKN